MSGTFPSSPGIRQATPRNRNFNNRSESVSGREQVRNRGGQRWEFTLQFPPMKRATWAPIDAFLTDQEGGLDTFQIVLPELSDSSGSASGTALTNATGAIGATSIAVDGFTGSLKAGDFIKFASHEKVYKLTADRSGAGTMSFKPGLVAAVANNEGITYNSVPFTVRQSGDVQEWEAGIGGIFNFELDIREAL